MACAVLVTAADRNTKASPCLVCGLHHSSSDRCWGYRYNRKGGELVQVCMRDEFANGLTRNAKDEGYHHVVEGGQPRATANRSPAKPASPKKDEPEIPHHLAAVYVYDDLDGNPRHRVERKDADFIVEGEKKLRKEIFQQSPDGHGRWRNTLKGVERVLYNLKGVTNAIEAGHNIYVVEGEKNAEFMIEAGLNATTACGGASAFTYVRKDKDDDDKPPDYGPMLANGNVVLICDNDKPGEKWLADAVKVFTPHAATVTVLDLHLDVDGGDVIDFVNGGHSLDELTSMVEIARTDKEMGASEAIDSTAALLGEVYAFVRRFVVLTDSQVVLLALWVLHAYVFRAMDSTPYVHVTSAEPRSGKSRLLEVIELLVPKPLKADNISGAALAHSIENGCTLLLDEIDSVFKPSGRQSDTQESLRGIVNGGFRRSGRYIRMAGKGTEMTPKTFSTFGPKMLAGIGELPQTVRDRCVRIVTTRKLPTEHVERFRYRAARLQGEAIAERVSVWADSAFGLIQKAESEIPDELDDRMMDAWEPLLAIAELAGGEWPERSRSSALVLSGQKEAEDASLGVRLLSDIQDILKSRMSISSADLLAALSSLEESPWSDWFGKTFTGKNLAQLLKPYGIKSTTVRVVGNVTRGYKTSDFNDAFTRYVPGYAVSAVTSVTPAYNASEGVTPTTTPTSPVTVSVTPSSTLRSGVTDVTGETPHVGDLDVSQFAQGALIKNGYKTHE